MHFNDNRFQKIKAEIIPCLQGDQRLHKVQNPESPNIEELQQENESAKPFGCSIEHENITKLYDPLATCTGNVILI